MHNVVITALTAYEQQVDHLSKSDDACQPLYMIPVHPRRRATIGRATAWRQPGQQKSVSMPPLGPLKFSNYITDSANQPHEPVRPARWVVVPSRYLPSTAATRTLLAASTHLPGDASLRPPHRRSAALRCLRYRLVISITPGGSPITSCCWPGLSHEVGLEPTLVWPDGGRAQSGPHTPGVNLIPAEFRITHLELVFKVGGIAGAVVPSARRTLTRTCTVVSQATHIGRRYLHVRMSCGFTGDGAGLEDLLGFQSIKNTV